MKRKSLITFVFLVMILTIIMPLSYGKYLESKNSTLTLSIRKPHYTVIFNKNGADGNEVMDNQEFTYGTGNLNPNLYTYTDHAFAGWTLNSDGSGTVYLNGSATNTLSAVDGGIVTLYAKWIDEDYDFYIAGPCVFGGSGTTHDNTCSSGRTNYINTGIKLFDETNAFKDFEVKFTIDSYDPTDQDADASFFSNMYESGSPYQGVSLSADDSTKISLRANVNTVGSDIGINYNGQNPIQVVIKKVSGYVYYSIDGGITFAQVEDRDYETFTSFMNNSAVFGAIIKPKKNKDNPDRFIVATLSDMSIKITDPKKYTVTYDNNGGTGTMANQEIMRDRDAILTLSTFTKTGKVFQSWNTEADGSGTTYNDGATVKNIASSNQIITLYARWVDEGIYYVNFNANGGTGTMPRQTVNRDKAVALSANLFTYANHTFAGWNTAPDGSGTHYDDEEFITNLANIDEAIDLYAEWDENVYYIAFDPNGGTGTMVNQKYFIGASQQISANTLTNGSEDFLGWNTQADGTGVYYSDQQSVQNLSTTVNDVVTLYAVWTKASYVHSAPVSFDGTNYINTGVRLFDADTINKDFRISFTIESLASTNSQVNSAVIVTAMDTNGNTPYPGFGLHRNNKSKNYVFELNSIDANNTSHTNSYKETISNNMNVVIQRVNGVISYSLNGGTMFKHSLDYSNFNSGSYFSQTVFFGGSPNGQGADRFLKGTISNISVERFD